MTSNLKEEQSNLPVIDFAPFWKDEGVVIGEEATEGQKSVARQIDAACRDHGFVWLDGLIDPTRLRDSIFPASKLLFDLSDPIKSSQLAPIGEWTNMGYAPFASETLNLQRPPELKEAYNVRFPPENQNNLQGCPPQFVQVSNELLEHFRQAIPRYALACALALDLPGDFFTKTLQTLDLSTIRFLHMPPCHFQAANADTPNVATRVGEHTDFGAFTLLMLGEYGAEGLQLKAVPGGEVQQDDTEGWMDVRVPPYSTIVNTGALMARWTNDTWRATAHRVVVQNTLQASRHRYSIACFVDPDAKTMVQVHPIFCPNGQPKKYPDIQSSHYLAMKLQEMTPKPQGAP